jgi:hypothetical protein
VKTLFGYDFVGRIFCCASTCGTVASSDVAILVGVENVGLSVRGWVGFIVFVWLGAVAVE